MGEEVTQMLEPGEAHAQGICNGETYPQPKGRVLTGITIAKRENPVTVYFGCYSEDYGEGGLGILQLSASHTGLQRKLSLVKYNGDSPVHGGALFLVENW